jgi:UDP-glucose 4-epimerase
MINILITGACGYVGARISKYLAEKGHKITAFDSFDPSAYSQWTSLMENIVIGDIRNEDTILELTKNKFDVAIHLISLDHSKSKKNPNYVSSVNVLPTWNLLDNLTQKGLKKFIYFSTIHVYGNLPNERITENKQSKPLNEYGLTHLLSEHICNYYNTKSKTECINVRLSNSYGSPIFKQNSCWWLVINELCKTAMENNEIRLKSNGSPQRDFIHLDDVSRAVNVMINNKNMFVDNILHISSGVTMSISELAQAVKTVFQIRYHKDIHVIYPRNNSSDKIDTTSKSKCFIIDNSKLNTIGFEQKIDLNHGINEVFDYLENSNDK